MVAASATLLGACTRSAAGPAVMTPSILEPGVASVSGKAPPVSGDSLSGARVSPALYGGHVLVVNFWNPDCPACRKEAPALAAAARKYGSQGVRFVGVIYVGGNWPDSPSAARAFLSKYHITYPVIIDHGSRISGAFGVAAIPQTFVVDASGQKRYVDLGQTSPAALARMIGPLSG